MGMVTYKDRANFKCDMCHNSSWDTSNRFLWIGFITEQELDICEKCAKREVGKKKWKEMKESI